jgi:hypothetical protein
MNRTHTLRVRFGSPIASTLRTFTTTACPLYVALYTTEKPPPLNGSFSISSNSPVRAND